MSIYDYDLANATELLLPPNKRKPTTLAYLGVFAAILQRFRDLFLEEYADGTDYIDFTPSISYIYTERRRDIDGAIYEVITVAGITGIATRPALDPTNWIKVLNKFVGARERAKYTSQNVTFEYALNINFKTIFRQFTGWDGAGNPTPLSDIFIVKLPVDTGSFIVGIDEDESSAVRISDTVQKSFIGTGFVFNPFMFSLNMPLAVYDALIPTDPSGITVEKDNIVRGFADNYVLGGVTYTIITY